MRPVSAYEALTKPLRTDLGMADEYAGMNVFVPGLMGAGILMSAGLLVGDGIKRLFPSSGTRRRVEVTRGVQSVVAGVAAAAGVVVEEQNISRRRTRSVSFYALGAIVLGAIAVLAVAKGIVEYNGEGVFEGNAIAIVFGSSLGAVAGGLAAVFAILSVVRDRRIPMVTTMVETTALGRLKPPPDTRIERARLLVPQFHEREDT